MVTFSNKTLFYVSLRFHASHIKKTAFSKFVRNLKTAPPPPKSKNKRHRARVVFFQKASVCALNATFKNKRVFRGTQNRANFL